MRVIDYWQPISTQFWLFTLYNKNEAANLSAKQRAMLAQLLNSEIEARQAQ